VASFENARSSRTKKMSLPSKYLEAKMNTKEQKTNRNIKQKIEDRTNAVAEQVH
jgi:hypothetical protein